MEAKKGESISNLLSPSPLGRPDTQAIKPKLCRYSRPTFLSLLMYKRRRSKITVDLSLRVPDDMNAHHVIIAN